MAYDVLDVSRYIINYSNDMGYSISNLKLQKLLYFVQAKFLTDTEWHRPCFNEAIEAWDFGPVVPKAYHEFKQFGSGDIPKIRTYIRFDNNNIWNTRRCIYVNKINEEDRSLINGVVDHFKDYSASELVTLTHNQSPWINNYKPYYNNEIPQIDIRRYFE